MMLTAGLNITLSTQPLMMMNAATSWLCSQLVTRNTKEARKARLQMKATLDKNRSQRIGSEVRSQPRTSGG